MKTEELITLLASGATPVDPRAIQRRMHNALGWGLFATTLAMAVTLGVRPDMDEAVWLPLFWFKLAAPAAATYFALNLAVRLGRPGARLAGWPWLLLGVLLLTWMSGLASWLMANPSERHELMFGTSWRECLISITLLALPMLIAALWAVKGLAPTRPTSAGAAAGLLAGTASATIYALHCTEMALPFLAIWYVAGVLIPAAMGYAIGKRWLRW